MKSSTKRLLSLVIVLALALSMLPMVTFAADAILYVKPNANWNIDNARFAAYFFGNGETWVDCTDADGDGVYEVVVPAGYTSIIFCRMNPKTSNNTWSNKWNQTADLKIADAADGKVCYVVADGTWDKGNGQWVEYVPGGQVETEPTQPNAFTYYVAGTSGLCGSEWSEKDDNNGMTDENADGIFTKVYTEVAAGAYKFKVTDGTWSNAWPAQDYALDVAVKSNVTINFNTADQSVTVDIEPLEDVPETEPTQPTEPVPATYTVAGAAQLCGSDWTPADTNNLMTDEDADGIYTKSYTEIAAGTYQFKVTDGTWNNSWGGTGDNGNYEITLVVKSNVTILFNAADKTIQVEIEALEEIPETEPTEPTPKEYCLVGYINGADYGCNDDYETIGEYIFVDGTLTTAFTADSYIFVKTTDNANWYLTEAYCSDTTGTFVANGKEKMFVPGNRTVTFTLTENQDGSITVSYECNESTPTEPPKPTDPSEPDPGVTTYYVAGNFNDWTNPHADYVMISNGDGTYSLSFAVTAGPVELKVTNGTWEDGGNWGDNGGNVVGKVSTDRTITVTFDPETGKVTVDGLDEKEPLAINSVYAVGAKDLTGFEWDPAATQMTCTDGIYSITFENIAAGTYEFKFAANGAWDYNWASGNVMEPGNVYEAWFNAMGNSSVVVTEDGSNVTLYLDLNAMDPYNGEGGKCYVEIVTSEPVPAVTVSGAVTTGAEGETLVELFDGETQITAAAVDGKTGTYTLENVAAGTYTLKVSKLNHVTREYTVTVGTDAVTQDVKIHLKGDIDGNGKVNTGDVAKLNAHLKNTNKLTDEYMILCANVNGGSLNMGDTAALYGHIKGTKPLY